MSFINRLKKNHRHLSKWARKQNIEAYRIYDRDIPEFPYIIDVYQDFAIVWLRLQPIDLEKGEDYHQNLIEEGLKELGIQTSKVIFKERRKQTRDDRYQKENTRKLCRQVKEGELLFETNLSDYLDTGLFLDHRNWRLDFSKRDLKGIKALNLFCYTGSLSVALAKAGAKVLSSDLNKNYLEWAKRNFLLNGLSLNDHQFVAKDSLTLIKDLDDDQESFDLIVIDPPSFSTSKKFKGTWDIQRDHIFLLSACRDLLKDGGELFFSTNLRNFKLDERIEGFKETTFQTIPQDFHDKKIHKSFYFKKVQS